MPIIIQEIIAIFNANEKKKTEISSSHFLSDVDGNFVIIGSIKIRFF